ncbi:hypothetical protein C8J57DRAFT_1468887 [Mycena rebaudengoi]|nr:hypothetical protein C8J57DRAFT_1468887 [Mycena rebaudengoi]
MPGIIEVDEKISRTAEFVGRRTYTDSSALWYLTTSGTLVIDASQMVLFKLKSIGRMHTARWQDVASPTRAPRTTQACPKTKENHRPEEPMRRHKLPVGDEAPAAALQTTTTRPQLRLRPGILRRPTLRNPLTRPTFPWPLKRAPPYSRYIFRAPAIHGVDPQPHPQPRPIILSQVSTLGHGADAPKLSIACGAVALTTIESTTCLAPLSRKT